jgi:hypothetical protein
VIVQVYSSGGFKRESISSAAIKVALGPAPRTLGATPPPAVFPGKGPSGARGLAGFFHASIPIWSQATRNSRSFHVGACRAQRRCRH